jgi:hypothetical protein
MKANKSWRDCFTNTSPPLTEEELDGLEAAVGIKLPPEIRELYSVVGKGCFEKDFFVADDGAELEIQTLVSARPTELDRGFAARYLDLVKTRQLIPERLVPFAVGSGGDFAQSIGTTAPSSSMPWTPGFGDVRGELLTRWQSSSKVSRKRPPTMKTRGDRWVFIDGKAASKKWR